MHRSSHHLALLSLFSLSLSLPFSSTSQPNETNHITCSPTEFSCGSNRYNISYPFRLPTSPTSCGHPGFDLLCIDSTLRTTLGPKSYQITDLDYADRILHLADPNFTAGSCPQTLTNTTLDPSLFRYTAFDANLTVFVDCSVLGSNPNFSRISCNGSGGLMYLYCGVTPPESSLGRECGSVVEVPVYGSVADLVVRGEEGFVDAVKEGFGVSWTVGSEWCGGCADSGGVCGFDPGSLDGSACFCADGTDVGGDGTCALSSKSNKNKTKIIVGLVTGSVGFLLACLLSVLYVCWRTKSFKSIILWKKNLNNEPNVEAFLENCGYLNPKRYMYSDVKKITKCFQDKLGQGGYGTVFKGNLSNGHPVAVKVLGDIKGNGEEFVNEVASIGRTSHVNIVSLLGFCLEGPKRALIYDFMCNGSLEKSIYSEKPKTILDWERLYQIAVGVARGLEYLHRGCNDHIVHFDIKPHNILLDQDFCPKISDFGLAKLCPRKDSILFIAGTRGTIGYIAPEIFSRSFGVVSSKSDVYSYGMMLLEMVGGRKNVIAGADDNSEIYFPHWIYEHLDQIADLEAFEVTTETEEVARKMILVGLWCIQTMPLNRPSMSRVIEMLEGSISLLQVPPKPILCSPQGSRMCTASHHDSSQTACSSLINL